MNVCTCVGLVYVEPADDELKYDFVWRYTTSKSDWLELVASHFLQVQVKSQVIFCKSKSSRKSKLVITSQVTSHKNSDSSPTRVQVTRLESATLPYVHEPWSVALRLQCLQQTMMGTTSVPCLRCNSPTDPTCWALQSVHFPMEPLASFCSVGHACSIWMCTLNFRVISTADQWGWYTLHFITHATHGDRVRA